MKYRLPIYLYGLFSFRVSHRTYIFKIKLIVSWEVGNSDGQAQNLENNHWLFFDKPYPVYVSEKLV